MNNRDLIKKVCIACALAEMVQGCLTEEQQAYLFVKAQELGFDMGCFNKLSATMDNLAEEELVNIYIELTLEMISDLIPHFKEAQ